MADNREAKVRKAAEAAGLTLEQDGKLWRLVSANGTLVAADWGTGGGVPLEAIEAALA